MRNRYRGSLITVARPAFVFAQIPFRFFALSPFDKGFFPGYDHLLLRILRRGDANAAETKRKPFLYCLDSFFNILLISTLP